MSFSVYALLGKESPDLSNESLADELVIFFENQDEFSLQFERLPFSSTQTLALRWDGWLTSVAYEEGEYVRNDSIEIKKILGDKAPNDISQIDKRIRVVFSDDDSLEHTNHIIYVLDFLRGIKGILIFDPTQKDLIASNEPV